MNLGKHEIALVALRQLLERRRKIEGELYPGTLRIRVLIAECLEALGDLAGASVEIANVKDSFLASGMLPEHPAVRDVENLESRIARKQTDD
jgi:hypothetical protein